ncbi:glycerate kinase type-2 family protein [Allosphingosinicella humi]
MDERQILEAMFGGAVTACHPRHALPPHLPEPPPGRTILLALGKGAAAAAEIVEAIWKGPLTGLALAPHGTAARLRHIDLLTAGHPVPDAASVAAAQRLLALAGEAGPDDLVLVLLSGGASALACLPTPALALAEKQRLTEALLRSGAPISAINTVRRHLSAIKGGRLAAAAQPARLVTLAISDVVGDRPEEIGSGPTVADPTRIDDAKAALAEYGIEPPARGWSESVKPAETAHWRADFRIVARNADALEAAAAEARRHGYAPVLLTCEGEARIVAGDHARRALEARAAERRIALISGGELTVTMKGTGAGGPNQEYALALALALKGTPGIHALAADTDGIDGRSTAAGAFVDPSTLARAQNHGLDAERALGDNDSGGFFAKLGDLFMTGPTGTNANDLRILLVAP